MSNLSESILMLPLSTDIATQEELNTEISEVSSKLSSVFLKLNGDGTVNALSVNTLQIKSSFFSPGFQSFHDEGSDYDGVIINGDETQITARSILIDAGDAANNTNIDSNGIKTYRVVTDRLIANGLSSYINDDELSVLDIDANNISVENLFAKNLSTSNIGDLSSSNITADNISVENLFANIISSSNLTSDNISVENLTVDLNIDAQNIVTHDLTVNDELSAQNVSASYFHTDILRMHGLCLDYDGSGQRYFALGGVDGNDIKTYSINLLGEGEIKGNGFQTFADVIGSGVTSSYIYGLSVSNIKFEDGGRLSSISFLSDIYELSSEVVDGLSNVVVPKLDTIADLVSAEVNRVDEISANYVPLTAYQALENRISALESRLSDIETIVDQINGNN